ncbi:MAG: RiPP maturation radical SAM C-methyltransferase, partial [Desulfococcus multivorans]|nr:RiPP maturation radical SAM C-methyltransferase [Desulfococcus multivorans]
IRRKVPHLPLIIGGSFIGGRTAADLLKVFPEIDLIVIGEGEKPLARLIEQLRTGEGLRDLRSGNGIISRNCVEDADETSLSQLPDLSGLPRPDFSEYFDLLAKFPGDRRFFPTLPLEASRGCWWQSVTPAAEAQTQPKGCAFCNLNVQWQGYRAKAPTQVVSEVENLTSAHKVLSVAFMDNVLPPKQSREIFTALAATGKDFQFFAELRASTSLPMLEILAQAGVSEVQIGIESLSSRLLKKLNKGTTAMDNLEIMKHCEGLGIQNAANLILHFPGSDQEDVAETLRAIRFARFFRPLRIVQFWLGMDSPVWKNSRDFGLKAVFNHPAYKSLFPEAIYRRVQFMVQDYRGDKGAQHKLWRPVVEAVEAWRSDYAKLHADPSDGPILTLHDGRSFLILRERRAGAEPVNHRLEGSSRKIYLSCNRQRRFSDIAETFAPLSGEAIRSFLAMMVRKGLMFAENDAYLSLAVQKRRTRGASPPA